MWTSPPQRFLNRLWSMILSAASQLDRGPKPKTRTDNRCSLWMSVSVLIIPSTLWGPVTRSHALMERWHQKKASRLYSDQFWVLFKLVGTRRPCLACPAARRFYYVIAGSVQQVGSQTCLIPPVYYIYKAANKVTGHRKQILAPCSLRKHI